MNAHLTVETSDVQEIEKLVGTESDFTILQSIYNTNAAGELPLFPKYAMSEYLEFKTALKIETDLFGKDEAQVDSEKVYGIKSLDSMTFAEQVTLAHQLHDRS